MSTSDNPNDDPRYKYRNTGIFPRGKQAVVIYAIGGALFLASAIMQKQWTLGALAAILLIAAVTTFIQVRNGEVDESVSPIDDFFNSPRSSKGTPKPGEGTKPDDGVDDARP